jgi:hypothetical protein
MTALVELGVLHAKLPGVRSRWHRLDRLLIPVSGYWGLRKVIIVVVVVVVIEPPPFWADFVSP